MAPRKNTAATKPAAKKATARKATGRTAASKAADAVDTAATQLDGGQFADFLTELRDLVDKFLSPIGTTAPNLHSAAKVAADEADEEPSAKTREEREEQLGGLTVRALQDILIGHDYDAKDVRPEKDKDLLITNILEEEYPKEDGDEEEADTEDEDEDEDEDADEEEDEDEEDDEDDEDAELDRDELLGMSLRELKKLATEQYSIDASELKGLDKDAIVDAIFAANEDVDDEDEDDDEGDEEYYTAEELQEYGIAELRGICKENNVSFTAAQGKSKAALIKLITA